MKILKIAGIVFGVHLFALTLIFTSPGCNSASKPRPNPTDTVLRSGPAPAITLPGESAFAGPGATGAPILFNPDAPATAGDMGVRSFPTRPGTPVATTLVAPPPPEVVPATTHTVVAGDNLWSLSRRYDITTTEIAAANNIRTSDVLNIGQKLIIPGGTGTGSLAFKPTPAAPVRRTEPKPQSSADGVRHVVKAGETLSTIARQYGVKQSEIAVANSIANPQLIRAGTELVIPGWRTPASAAANLPVSEPAQDSPDSLLIFNPDEAAPEVPVIRVDESPISSAPKDR